MNHIEQLQQDADRIKASIREKEKQIEVLKSAVKVDKKRLKATEEGIALYTEG